MYRFNAEIDTPLSEFNKIIPPPDRFWADPHIVCREERYFGFVEELIYSSGKAHIAVFEIDENGMTSAPVKVLSEEYHLSYPFVFESEGDLYMVPETNANSTISLYRCLEFPGKWQLVENIMEHVSAVDATLHYQDDQWWLFAGIKNREGASLNDELCIYSSDRLLNGTWKPHRKNPVISDVRRARPAGPLFHDGDKLYRPSQNSSYHYGYGFNLNSVTTLSNTEYAEEIIHSVTPDFDPSIIGTHTYSVQDRLTVVDALMLRSKFRL